MKVRLGKLCRPAALAAQPTATDKSLALWCCRAAYIHWFQALYYLASFFAQYGPNCTTWLIAAELIPTDARALSHGIAAAVGAPPFPLPQPPLPGFSPLPVKHACQQLSHGIAAAVGAPPFLCMPACARSMPTPAGDRACQHDTSICMPVPACSPLLRQHACQQRILDHLPDVRGMLVLS
jgi:hypothetical protein